MIDKPKRVRLNKKTAERAPQHTPPREEVRVAQHVPDHAVPRQRRRKANVGHDDLYYINREEIPEGQDYEWKRWSVYGEENPFYIRQMQEQGWEPVNPKRHPNWLPPGYNEPHIIKGGMILMERPLYLTREARAEAHQLAQRQIREAEQRLGKRAGNPNEADRLAPTIQKEIGRMVPQAIEE